MKDGDGDSGYSVSSADENDLQILLCGELSYYFKAYELIEIYHKKELKKKNSKEQ